MAENDRTKPRGRAVRAVGSRAPAVVPAVDAVLLRGLTGPVLVALVLLGAVGLLLEAGTVLARAAVIPPVHGLLGVMLGLLPAVLELALPLAFLTGLVVVLGRWHDDGTWIALRACGVGGHRLLRPASAGALLCGLLLLGASHLLAPVGRRVAAAQLVRACSELTPQPGGFLPLGGAMLHRPVSGGLLLSLGEVVIVAREGTLAPRAGGLLLRLHEGEALLGAPGGAVLRFEAAEVPLALDSGHRRVELVERSDTELRDLARRRTELGRDASYERLILLKRTSLALAVLLLPLVALPLALRWGGRAAPVLGVVLLLWVLIRVGDGACAWLGPWAAAALPLAGLVAAALALWAGWRDR